MATHTWKIARVTRKNAGGNLYNAVRTDTGAECSLEPSHNAALIRARVVLLNAGSKPRYYRGYTIAPNGDAWAYRAQSWDMWSAPMTLAECKAAIDGELASYSGTGK